MEYILHRYTVPNYGGYDFSLNEVTHQCMYVQMSENSQISSHINLHLVVVSYCVAIYYVLLKIKNM